MQWMPGALATQVRQPAGIPMASWGSPSVTRILGGWNAAYRLSSMGSRGWTGGGSNRGLMGQTRVQDGVVVTTDTSSPNIWESIALARFLRGNRPFTFAMRARITGTPSTARSMLRFDGAGEWFGFAMGADRSLSASSVRWSGTSITADSIPNIGDIVTLVAVVQSGNSRLWVNGVMQSGVNTQATSVFNQLRTNFEVYVSSEFQLYGGLLFEGALSDGEVQQLSRNFWAPFASDRSLAFPVFPAINPPDVKAGIYLPGALASLARSPVSTPKVDLSNSITKDLAFTVLPGLVLDSLNNRALTSNIFSSGARRIGPTLYTPGTTIGIGDAVHVRSGGPILGPLTNSTVLGVFRTRAGFFNGGTADGNQDIGAGGKAIYSERASTGNDIYKIGVATVTGAGTVEFTYRNDAGTLLQQRIPASTLNDGKVHVAVGRKLGTSHSAWYDGQPSTGTFGSASTAFTNSNISCRIASDAADLTADWNGEILLVAGWSRALSDEEIKFVSQNPWILFNKERMGPTQYTVDSSSLSITSARPSADSLTTDWTVTPAISYYDAIDEEVASDTDFIISPNSASPENSPIQFVLDNELPAGTWSVKFRARNQEASDMTVDALLVTTASGFEEYVGSAIVDITSTSFEEYTVTITSTAPATLLRFVVYNPSILEGGESGGGGTPPGDGGL